ncbi:DUF6128 domain-containing protein [Muricomes intestini]
MNIGTSPNTGRQPTGNMGRQPTMNTATPPNISTDRQPAAETADNIPTMETPEELPPGVNSTTIAGAEPKTTQSSFSESQPQDLENVQKIQRSDLSILPRKYWNIANNSFLMHGYHNYHHLMLVESNGHYWLGVPGVFSPREARAAELFGFPQFTKSHVKRLTLSDDERDDSEEFGHWCRYMM